MHLSQHLCCPLLCFTYPFIEPFGIRALGVCWGKIKSRMQDDESGFGVKVLKI
jgi:hypothetical protein